MTNNDRVAWVPAAHPDLREHAKKLLAEIDVARGLQDLPQWILKAKTLLVFVAMEDMANVRC